jgi:serine/threonine-protein kinase PknK
MSQANWQKVRDLFDAALNKRSDERAAYLEVACAGDVGLINEVESLLASLKVSESFLETPIVGGVSWRLEKGSRLSHFLILEPIGAGGMGEIYLAEDERLRRRVALKVLPSHVRSDESLLLRFQHEAATVSALNHPNILTIYEFENAGGIHFFASEFVEGTTLRNAMSAKPLPLRDSLLIAKQIASALGAAHDAGVVHRDIKPENVMVRNDGLVKVLDFGLAKQQVKHVSGETNTTLLQHLSVPGMIMGTVSYMSPEQARGTTIDNRSDIFSLGIVLYEMLTGRPPFIGETAIDVIAEIVRNDAVAPSMIDPRISKELDLIVLKMLEKEPGLRFQSARDLEVPLSAIIRKIEFAAEDAAIDPIGSAHSVARPAGAVSGSELPPLVGREDELNRLLKLLKDDGKRLVTLTGIGGTGKTRVALELCRRLEDHFADGYAFVRLSELHDSSHISHIVAQQLKVQEIVGKSMAETLEDHLRPKNLLLVLDNFEQIVDAAPFVGTLLSSSPGLSIVVTSRERLRLQAETEFNVPPLPVPDPEEHVDLDHLQKFDSVRLFVERARNVDPGFELDTGNAFDIARICSTLDGLPLAIELAAARTRLFSTAMILEKLNARLTFLTGGPIDLPKRQQTMRAAVDWSYDLLNDDEKRLFRRLSVFSCRFTLPAAEEICCFEAETGSDAEFVDIFASLADKSLLARRKSIAGEVGYCLLEIVREYAQTVLQRDDDADLIRRRHALYFLSLAEKAEPHLRSGNSACWIAELDSERDNLVSALEWSIEKEPAVAARLAAAIRHFWLTRGFFSEGLTWSEIILDRVRDIPDAIRWKILMSCGNINQFRGEIARAEEYYEKALLSARSSEDQTSVAQSLRGLAAMAYIRNDLVRAKEFIDEAIKVSRVLGDDFGLAASLARLGDIKVIEGDLDEAQTLTAESLAIFRRLGYTEGVSAKLYNLGAIVFLSGQYDLARQHFVEAYRTASELGEKINTRLIFDGFAALAAVDRDFARAARLSGVAESLGTTIGYSIEPAEQNFRDAYLGKLKASMPSDEFEAEHQAGQKLSAEAARMYAFPDDQIS